jgi:hypothetical protein
VDPTAEVAVGGLGGLSATSTPSITGLKFLHRLTRTRPAIDAVAIHPYAGYADRAHPPWVHVPNGNNFDNIQRVHDQLLADGERAPIWVTEWGWSSATVGDGRQALYVKRSLQMLEHRYRFVRVATYFLDHDLPPTLFQGLLDEHLDAKPAARVFRSQADLAASRCQAKP